MPWPDSVIDIALLLSYRTEMLVHKAQFKNQQLELHAAHVTIMVNLEKMWRVISNLIINAIKFSPRDTKIFDLFPTAPRKGTEGEAYYGLGLGIRRQIVESHSGKIWFKNNAEKGCIFYITLPHQMPKDPF